MTEKAVISGSGVYHPPHVITNDELVDSYNKYATEFNQTHKSEIERGEIEAVPLSSSEFIEKASGIKQRYAIEKEGVLDTKRMRPYIPARKDDELSLQAEFSLDAIHAALDNAQKRPEDVDGLIMATSEMQRPYPSISIEVQQALGFSGFAYDSSVACSSATFGIAQANALIQSGQANCIVVVSPEIACVRAPYRDRDSHFIFGDVCTATIIENKKSAQSKTQFEILSSKLVTDFSNNIRNNNGYLNWCEVEDDNGIPTPQMFKQNGRKVFKEVCPMAIEHILSHVQQESQFPLKRLWLHQANINMNTLIAKKVFERLEKDVDAPNILEEFANTGSAGSIVAFDKFHDDFAQNELGIICSFGAGYSIGSVALARV